MTRTKTRALANWPNNAVSVLDFGAVGDGVTDDTAAIQAAITASEGCSCGTSIHFPGNYLVSGQLNITKGSISLLIPGRITTTSSDPLFYIELNASNITFNGFKTGKLVGPNLGVYTKGSSAISNNFAENAGISNILVENFDSIENWDDAGIGLSKVTELQIVGCSFKDNFRAGILVAWSDYVTIDRCNIDAMNSPGYGGDASFLNAYGLTVTSDGGLPNQSTCKHINITNNKVKGPKTWQAIDTHGVEYAVISGNIIESAMMGIYLGASTGTNNLTSHNITCSNNIIRGIKATTPLCRNAINAISAIPGEYSNNITVKDNVIEKMGLNQAAVDAGYTGSLVGEGAIVCGRLRNGLISGNAVKTSNNVGIEIRSDCLCVNVSNNTIENTSPLTGYVQSHIGYTASDGNSNAYVSNNSFMRTAGSGQHAFNILSKPPGSAGLGFVVDQSNYFQGSQFEIFSNNSYENMANTSTWRTRIYLNAGIAADGTITRGFLRSIVKRGAGEYRLILSDNPTDLLDWDTIFITLSASQEAGSGVRKFSYVKDDDGSGIYFIDVTVTDETDTAVDSAFNCLVTGGNVDQTS